MTMRSLLHQFLIMISSQNMVQAGTPPDQGTPGVNKGIVGELIDLLCCQGNRQTSERRAMRAARAYRAYRSPHRNTGPDMEPTISFSSHESDATNRIADQLCSSLSSANGMKQTNTEPGNEGTDMERAYQMQHTDTGSGMESRYAVVFTSSSERTTQESDATSSNNKRAFLEACARKEGGPRESLLETRSDQSENASNRSQLAGPDSDRRASDTSSATTYPGIAYKPLQRGGSRKGTGTMGTASFLSSSQSRTGGDAADMRARSLHAAPSMLNNNPALRRPSAPDLLHGDSQPGRSISMLGSSFTNSSSAAPNSLPPTNILASMGAINGLSMASSHVNNALSIASSHEATLPPSTSPALPNGPLPLQCGDML